MPASRTKYVTGGGMRVDYLITRRGEAFCGLAGGNALYAAVGAALWSDSVGIWARIGENYPDQWPIALRDLGLSTAGLRRVAGKHDHRTFYAYTEEGRRIDSDPRAHFGRIGRTLPEELADYINSTPGQDDPETYEPLALRPKDWPEAYGGAAALHLAPHSIRTHLTIPAYLQESGIEQISIDPGERYMVPELAPFLRQILPQLEAFLPSDQEIQSLFGPTVDPELAAETLGSWGTRLLVIKTGPQGVLVYEKDSGRFTHVPAYHPPGDARVIDETGAGDAFCGGFMVGLAESGKPVLAARMGVVSASIVIEGHGALYALSRRNGEAAGRLAEHVSTHPR